MGDRYIYVVEGRDAYLNGCTPEAFDSAQTLWHRGARDHDA